TRFDGLSDPMGFLERLEELQDFYDVQPETLLKLLPEMLTGDATAWFRNNRRTWRTWNDFLDEFRSFYLPNYADSVEDLIMKRRQQPGESGREFVQVMQTLLRRHGGYTREAALRRVYTHLLPEYHQYIRRSDFRSIGELMKM